MINITIAIHESKNLEKVVKFVSSIQKLEEYTSHKTAIKILKASENGALYGLYFTKTGKVRAEYI